ncbi:MAG TPA: cobalamin-binding protein [Burkholderiales bacterium]|nr:cobalamin-binding protein [Burkholderiales bacterium]
MFVLLLPLLALSSQSAFALSIIDDAGNELAFDRPVRRVVSLSPHLTELLYAIGAADTIVGTVRGSDYPAEAATLPEIGDAAGLDFERILQARPDVVLAWSSGNRAVDIERLREIGLGVLELEPRRLEDIARHLRLLGGLTGRAERAGEVAQAFEARIVALRDRFAGRARLRVLFEIWHAPLFTINGDHIISRVIRLCGGENIFAGLPRLAAEISLEQVLAGDPDAIVVGSEAADAGVANWSPFAWMKAVRGGNVFAVSADLITRQTPRIADAAERMCAGIDKARR